MSTDNHAAASRIYDEWNAGFNTKDLERVMALYAEDAVIETPAVLANYPEAADGILRGKDKIRALFAKNLVALSTTFQGLYRPVQYFSDGAYLTWEYPRLTPSGSQVDLFESMDIENGLIVYHRVYWGWSGFQKLQAVREAAGRADKRSADLAILQDLNRHYVRSVDQSDVAWFREHLAPDFMNTNPDGTLLDKDAFVAQIGRGSPVRDLREQDVDIRLFGDFAIIRAHTTYVKSGGEAGRGRYTDDWQRSNGRWLCVSAHVTRI